MRKPQHVEGVEIPIGGRDLPGHGWDPKKFLGDAGKLIIGKDDITVGDLKANGGIVNPEQAASRKKRPAFIKAVTKDDPSLVFGFDQVSRPGQVPITQKKPVPKIQSGAYQIAQSDENTGVTKESNGDDNPTEPLDNDGRPRWMAAPGQGGKDPQYMSQKPGKNGNNDTLFSKDINTNPENIKPLNEDGYQVW